MKTFIALWRHSKLNLFKYLFLILDIGYKDWKNIAQICIQYNIFQIWSLKLVSKIYQSKNINYVLKLFWTMFLNINYLDSKLNTRTDFLN